jgi:hypothetical protein
MLNRRLKNVESGAVFSYLSDVRLSNWGCHGGPDRGRWVMLVLSLSPLRVCRLIGHRTRLGFLIQCAFGRFARIGRRLGDRSAEGLD